MADKNADSALRAVPMLASSSGVAEAAELAQEAANDPRFSTFRPRSAPLESQADVAELVSDRIPYHTTTRWFSLVALAALSSGVLYVVMGLYDAVRDSFVTPIVLSPDSDLVIPSKLSLTRLITDKSAIEIRLREATAVIGASDAAMEKLNALKALLEQSLTWSGWVTEQSFSTSSTDLETLAAQQVLLQQHITAQSEYVEEMQGNLMAGLVHKTDVLREQSQLSQLRIAALENQRERVASQALQQQSAAAKRALANDGAAVLTPEMVQQREQLVRIELELLKVEADKNARQDELQAARDELARTEQLIAQMRQRPVFRAIEAEQNVAFVPYSQLAGVRAGASVYACAIWGFFACSDVGEVREVLPGEVSMQDPWGAHVRGQYALMHLTDNKAAQAKLLRVRPAKQSSMPGQVLTSKR